MTPRGLTRSHVTAARLAALLRATRWSDCLARASATRLFPKLPGTRRFASTAARDVLVGPRRGRSYRSSRAWPRTWAAECQKTCWPSSSSNRRSCEDDAMDKQRTVKHGSITCMGLCRRAQTCRVQSLSSGRVRSHMAPFTCCMSR